MYIYVYVSNYYMHRMVTTQKLSSWEPVTMKERSSSTSPASPAERQGRRRPVTNEGGLACDLNMLYEDRDEYDKR